MKCTYCYANFQTYQNVKEKTTEQICSVIDELHSYGTRGLWFLGGEPMMRKDLGVIIDYAQSRGMFCDMNSNGVLINEKNIDIVKKLDGVCISLDGDEESNDYYRGEGSYQKAIAAIKLLKEQNVTVRLHSILTKRTWQKLDHMAKLSKELGIMFNYCEVLLNDPDREDHILNEQESKEFYKKYLDYKKRGYPIMHSLPAIEYIIHWPKKEGNLIYRDEASRYPRNSFLPCVYGSLECFYDLDGQVYSCPGTWDDGLNANVVGFKKAWDYLAQRQCIACRCMSAVQLRMVLGLNMKSLMYGIKQVISLSS
jgi:MoaA/NifB/PqqE/SkfB family radical SAM enzyme